LDDDARSGGEATVGGATLDAQVAEASKEGEGRAIQMRDVAARRRHVRFDASRYIDLPFFP